MAKTNNKIAVIFFCFIKLLVFKNVIQNIFLKNKALFVLIKNKLLVEIVIYFQSSRLTPSVENKSTSSMSFCA